jgi:hypothetical protein
VKGQNNFWLQNVFLTFSWRFLISNKLEKLELKLEKIIGIQKSAGKVRKNILPPSLPPHPRCPPRSRYN